MLPYGHSLFAAGEPFGVILLYPQTDPENVSVEVIEWEDNITAYEQAFQQMIDSPALHDIFLRMAATLSEQPAQGQG